MFNSRIFSDEEIESMSSNGGIIPGPDETVYVVEQEDYDPRSKLFHIIEYLIRNETVYILKYEVRRDDIVIKHF